uniref:Acetyl-coenzyme A carboxylase carboxyl transferase subunit alpha n=1 Tax=Laurencia catarinensis TaxID=197326 RepID=UPI0028D42411|nr:Acetyl-coenzyme A carboxylase carboxyl transferase subunit alpha [Laurencia catarinensis]WMP12426.1 Acetyl-coenzyme A carboxylase carboxyl transferase subunit alpha [Laurencia catarinensis]
MILRKSLSPSFLKPVIEFEHQLYQLEKILANLVNVSPSISDQIHELHVSLIQLKKDIFMSLTPLQKLHFVRQPDRPTTLDYMGYILDSWIELHGDRGGTDDLAIVGGIGSINSRTVVFIGHQRGKDTKDNVVRNFGMASPGGYRKALRLMRHANRFNFPILTFIDTPGAWAGMEAEKLGQGEAIAVNLKEMFSFEVPIICTIIGEGGSGGALGIGVGDKILMLQHAVYTVATPEACAAILWKDSTKSLVAAESLKITSYDLMALGIIDDIIAEPLCGSQSNPFQAAKNLKLKLVNELDLLLKLDGKERKRLRYSKFRQIGKFYESSQS